jgi:hypothetical protein
VCVPTDGVIEPNKDIPEQKDEKRILIWGNCYPRQAYVIPHKPEMLYKAEDLPKKVEQAYDSVKIKDEELIYSPLNNKIVVEFMKIDPSLPTQN